MPRITYEDFDVLFSRTGEQGSYMAQVAELSGDGKSRFNITDIFDAEDEAALLTRDADPSRIRNFELVASDGNPEKYTISNRLLPDADHAKVLGGRLFSSVFKGTLKTSFDVKREQLRVSRTFLRLRLHLTDVPELATLPWEYLYNADLNHFYAQLAGTQVIRYLDSVDAIENLIVDGPLRMLVAVASPSDFRALNSNAEWIKLKEALNPMITQDLLAIEFLEGATLDRLRQRLIENTDTPFHIFHFIGHGGFKESSQKGFLLFEDNNKKGRPISGESLGTFLHDHKFRLAVINSCEGAVAAEGNSYAGVAQELCRRGGIPAVVAMQYEIFDDTAVVFAETFYRALANSFPVEAALAEGRKAILSMPNEVEWATPVLYMRCEDGRLKAERPDRDSRPHAVVNDKTFRDLDGDDHQGSAGFAMRINEPLAAHYETVFDAIRNGQLVPFIGLDANLLGRVSNVETWQRAMGLPGSAELAAYLSREFKYPRKDLPDLARIAQYAIAADRLGDLYDHVSKIFTAPALKPTDLHYTIAEIAAEVVKENEDPDSLFLRCDKDPMLTRFVVVTTGYDNLLEAAFREVVKDFEVVGYMARGPQKGSFYHMRYVDAIHDPSPVFIKSPNDYNGLADGAPVILKLPGTVESQNSRFAISEDDYFDYLNNRELTNLLPAALTGKLKKSHLLFFGYSPYSWNMRALLYRIWEDQQSYRESWAILNEPNAIDELFWDKCQVKVLEANLSKYISGLRQCLTMGV